MPDLISRKTAYLALEWCIQNYGPSIHNDLDTLEIGLRSKHEYLGEYDSIENIIILNPKKHKTLKDWCNTVIHEYTHFKQNGDMYDRYYYKYGRNYDNHPHEVSAHKIAERDAPLARKWVLSVLRKKL